MGNQITNKKNEKSKKKNKREKQNPIPEEKIIENKSKNRNQEIEIEKNLKRMGYVGKIKKIIQKLILIYKIKK